MLRFINYKKQEEIEIHFKDFTLLQKKFSTINLDCHFNVYEMKSRMTLKTFWDIYVYHTSLYFYITFPKKDLILFSLRI